MSNFLTKNQLSKIDLKFINQVNELKNLSVAEDKKVGAIIANHKTGQILAIGYNKMFDDLGFQTCEDETGQSLPYVIHAEESAVIEFLKKDIKNIDLSELTLYCSYSACINCAKLIQHAGIKTTQAHQSEKTLCAFWHGRCAAVCCWGCFLVASFQPCGA